MYSLISESVYSASKKVDALYNALNYKILLLRITILKCIKCIKQEQYTIILLYMDGSQKENRHFMHFGFTDNDIFRKWLHFRMHYERGMERIESRLEIGGMKNEVC